MLHRAALARFIDLAVYAPVGLAVTVRERVQHSRRSRGRRPDDHVSRSNEAPDQPAPPVPVSRTARDAAGAVSDAPGADDLPISGYESLAAIHVVERLGSLTPAELKLIERFEAAHRGRRTILARVAQLQES